MIYTHIMRFNIPVHNSHRMTKVQCLQNLKHIKPNIIIHQLLIQTLEIVIIDILENNGWGSSHWILHNIIKIDYIWAASQIGQDFYFPPNFLLFNWFQDFDD